MNFGLRVVAEGGGHIGAGSGQRAGRVHGGGKRVGGFTGNREDALGGAAQSPDTAGDATNAGRGNGDGAVVQSGGLSDGHWERDLGAGVTGNSFSAFTGHKEIGCGEDRSCDY